MHVTHNLMAASKIQGGRNFAVVAAAFLLATGISLLSPFAARAAENTAAADDRPVIGIESRGPIKVVYQISESETKNGVGKGLFYLNKLYESYVKAGIDPANLDIHAVFHGSAAEDLLTDDSWNRVRNATSGNPNTALIAELAAKGVSVELCDTRRVANGWSKADVHPDVVLVGAAFQRIIDLQQRGYAYIRF